MHIILLSADCTTTTTDRTADWSDTNLTRSHTQACLNDAGKCCDSPITLAIPQCMECGRNGYFKRRRLNWVTRGKVTRVAASNLEIRGWPAASWRSTRCMQYRHSCPNSDKNLNKERRLYLEAAEWPRLTACLGHYRDELRAQYPFSKTPSTLLFHLQRNKIKTDNLKAFTFSILIASGRIPGNRTYIIDLTQTNLLQLNPP